MAFLLAQGSTRESGKVAPRHMAQQASGCWSLKHGFVGIYWAVQTSSKHLRLHSGSCYDKWKLKLFSNTNYDVLTSMNTDHRLTHYTYNYYVCQQPFLGILTWYPISQSSHCNLSENWTSEKSIPIDWSYCYLIFKYKGVIREGQLGISKPAMWHASLYTHDFIHLKIITWWLGP